MSYKFWESVTNDYEKLLETGEGYDVIIYVGENEKEFHAHSIILRIRSEYFRAAFSKNWAEKKDVMFIFKKPNIKPNMFQIILRFIYCGNVDLTKLQGQELLKLLIAVDELDIQPLISCIQEYFSENISNFLYQNPIEILEIFYQHQQFTDLWNFCLDKICEEPEKLINSDRFIDLEAPILEILLRRDDFALDEIIIWEGLIKWSLAQNLTIPQDIKKWNKEQITIMDKTLHEFIPLIRFYHIPSDDFFNKVLPYKELLPKQLINEISEFNKVSDKKSIVSIQPPRMPKYLLNLDSVIVEFQHFAMFASWIDKKDDIYYNYKNIPYCFKLLYRASKDGSNSKEFHKKCDNKGATIIIAKVKEMDRIVGGYNPLMWDSSNWTKPTTDSFIFSFTDKNDMSAAIIGRVKDANSAIYCASSLGPAFGPGTDLYNYNNNEWYCNSSYYSSINLPFSRFVTDDYEVFQVIKR
ncbi:hypothetical protein RclHR1_04410006 [Rhizophagus clarus]|uniref:BTB/POZ domain-containing protein n=1 Tax=Rhizophagus clarus TaxID=94130 RepID=A0A2Z6RM71_9GLOM|nr:hypothetical protein RclHR1_04410006 [Rhizophagus clarus]GES81032.1 BTB/POZ domain-containing protein [Rhizophagus clarus]